MGFGLEYNVQCAIFASLK